MKVLSLGGKAELRLSQSQDAGQFAVTVTYQYRSSDV